MAEQFEILDKALEKMLGEKKYAALRDILVVMNPSDIAALFDDFEKQLVRDVIRARLPGTLTHEDVFI